MTNDPESQTRPSGRYAVATVMADGMKTLYTRVGAGPTVLIIPPDSGVDAQGLQQACMDMGMCCRVILPGLPAALADRREAADPAAFTGWIRGILDGLGIREVTVAVLNPAWTAAMRRLHAEQPDRVKAVVALPADGLTGPAALAALEPWLGLTPLPRVEKIPPS